MAEHRQTPATSLVTGRARGACRAAAAPAPLACSGGGVSVDPAIDSSSRDPVACGLLLPRSVPGSPVFSVPPAPCPVPCPNLGSHGKVP